MSLGKAAQAKRILPGGFLAALGLIAAMYVIYGVNIAQWRNSPDFGWRTSYESGPNSVAQVFTKGEEAGLKVGDTIRAINGKPYTTFEELFFTDLRDGAPGAQNSYTVLQNGEPRQIRITTGVQGLATVLRRSGALYLLGLVFATIGVLVYLMKPEAPESRVFFAMTGIAGMFLSFSSPSDLIRPHWFYDVRRLIECIVPAPVIHLAWRFPKTRRFLQKRPWLWVLPYLAGILLLLLFRLFSSAYWNAPWWLMLAESSYLLMGVVVFLASMLWNMFRDESVVVRLQSRVIVVGIALGLLIPISGVLLRTLGVHLFPDPVIGYGICAVIFPMSIGYTIVKHDLFAIDLIVRRTYGYVLSTAAIVGAYSLVITVLNMTIRSSEFSRSPLFSILFALGAVFTFRPLHERIQGFVDRIFYRQRYDYRKTIKAVSEAMTSILDPRQIQKMLVGSVVAEMFLENGLFLLQDTETRRYEVQVAEGVEEGRFAGKSIAGDDPIVGHLQSRKAPFFRYELEMNPRDGPDREGLKTVFQDFGSEMMLPLRYKDDMVGILSLGGKKSGKLFTSEDIDLLGTLASQSAIALENAKLFEENVQKGRMEEELKIAHDIQASMLPDRAPLLEGITIAARSIPAREVGGDFYDFIMVNAEGGNGRLAIVVGDVSGKGVSGALVMAASRSVFRVLTEAHASVGEVMNRTNLRLHQDVKKGMFVAALYVVLDPGGGHIILSNAGQTQPILCPGDGSPPIFVETEGDRFPLGILQEARYEESRSPIKKGDTLVLYTDGVVEAVDTGGSMYGFDRFISAIAGAREMTSNDMLDFLIGDVMRFAGGSDQHDDITVVVAKVE